MAAGRLKLLHWEEVRATSQTSQLLNRLTDHVFGKVELSPAQVASAKVLLGKSLPDLSAVQIAGQDGGPVQIAAVGWHVKDA